MFSKPVEYPFEQKLDDFSLVCLQSDIIQNSPPPYSLKSPWSVVTVDHPSLKSSEIFTNLKQSSQIEIDFGNNFANKFENEAIFPSFEVPEPLKSVKDESTQIEMDSNMYSASDFEDDSDDSACSNLVKKHTETQTDKENLQIYRKNFIRECKNGKLKKTPKTRQNHSDEVINELTEWLIANRNFPYPDRSEKKAMMETTGLS
ncbi:hypothetical protein HK096_001997, partial [Nowakowskiella sp. JEL0078]